MYSFVVVKVSSHVQLADTSQMTLRVLRRILPLQEPELLKPIEVRSHPPHELGGQHYCCCFVGLSFDQLFFFFVFRTARGSSFDQLPDVGKNKGQDDKGKKARKDKDKKEKVL
jgi:hypothetical protein